jgi:hypothetical protein
LLVAGLLLIATVVLLGGLLLAGPAEPAPASAVLELLLGVGELSPQLPERGLLPHQCLRHLIGQGRWVSLDVLLDPG